ncbi:hypothetical protein ALP26_02858 [Pseudomonas savastanoi pv. glycinea]|uniref:Uncharacterized protein n=5 Tax=Pseudomonas savastanoi TaxID=29438 RepID=A0A3M3UKF0_PSESG|nr:Uncharacterized protein ALO55_04847 [Pseudomonas savastanoi pv. phaseolicola]RMM92306.1 hypothetical protein ALQ70_04925 [Pseudomonas savastanoi pv. glycinea]RMN00261.1 hypothetical protein ALQ67_00354 [Pseudomonas savastanoi pv. glycinea]RMN34535.1 hypothetical protein ALQ66_00538 [Pseudomonas savastanoi pv. glycinea]RMO06276.1 hypothetical protein ALQ46_04900 [Pseudomonas savastanoi pv. phaseolicola]
MLTGPGVMDEASANAAMEISIVMKHPLNMIKNDPLKVMTAMNSVLKEIAHNIIPAIRFT